jgi:hypothetical protein
VVESKLAITAIRNSKSESFVAQSLHRIGWKLIYRATDISMLLISAENSPEAIIVVSTDFGVDKTKLKNRVITLESRQEPTDHLIQELLRDVVESDRPKHLTPPLCSSRVTVVASLDSGLGGTTSAINLAHEKSRQGEKTLLLDFNSANPSLSGYFDIQRINRKISPTNFGFDIGEVSDLSTFAGIAERTHSYSQVIIDLGKIPDHDLLMSGMRVHEVLARWSIQSAAALLLHARCNLSSLKRLAARSFLIAQSTLGIEILPLLISPTPLLGREKRAIDDNARRIIAGEYCHLPSEARLIEKAASERAPLAHISPKSLLVQEIASLSKNQTLRRR